MDEKFMIKAGVEENADKEIRWWGGQRTEQYCTVIHSTETHKVVFQALTGSPGIGKASLVSLNLNPGEEKTLNT